MNTPQKTATITFTAEEARVTLQLFDAAVKSIGLNAAEPAAVLAKKINSAFTPSESVSSRREAVPKESPLEVGSNSAVNFSDE